jgi:hypothetical protein
MTKAQKGIEKADLPLRFFPAHPTAWNMASRVLPRRKIQNSRPGEE